MTEPAVKCRLCTVRLHRGNHLDDFVRQICGDCRQHPAAKRLGAVATPPPRNDGAPPDFTPAERSLIKRVGALMPSAQLLALLNERLQADGTPDAGLHTAEQLQAEMQSTPTPSGNTDWSSMRKLLAQARREGVLNRITIQTIDDFAVVYALSSAQVLRLKDVVLNAQEDGHGR
jgi:hypothetical protein